MGARMGNGFGDTVSAIRSDPFAKQLTADQRWDEGLARVESALHDKGFVSIGSAPCTRAIRPGEDFRAGRWWWEDASKKECGLHLAGPAEALETVVAAV